MSIDHRLVIRIITGIPNPDIRRKLLAKPDLDLKTVIITCRQEEAGEKADVMVSGTHRTNLKSVAKTAPGSAGQRYIDPHMTATIVADVAAVHILTGPSAPQKARSVRNAVCLDILEKCAETPEPQGQRQNQPFVMWCW